MYLSGKRDFNHFGGNVSGHLYVLYWCLFLYSVHLLLHKLQCVWFLLFFSHPKENKDQVAQLHPIWHPEFVTCVSIKVCKYHYNNRNYFCCSESKILTCFISPDRTSQMVNLIIWHTKILLNVLLAGKEFSLVQLWSDWDSAKRDKYLQKRLSEPGCEAAPEIRCFHGLVVGWEMNTLYFEVALILIHQRNLFSWKVKLSNYYRLHQCQDQ